MSISRRPSFMQDKDGPGLTFILVVLVVVAVLGAKYFGFAPGKKMAPSAQGQQQAAPETAPLVLVYTAHPTENYAPNPAHAKGTGSIMSVAQALVEALQAQQVKAQLFRDIPAAAWNQAFDVARVALQPTVAEAKGLAAILDIHRDAIEGKPVGYTTVMVDQKSVAKILLVVGDVENPNLEQNLAFAEELRTELETLVPGICRGVKILHDHVNGDLHARAVQVHIGDYTDNTEEEAKAAVGYLAQAVAKVLLRGQ